MERKKNNIFYAAVILTLCCLVSTTFVTTVASDEENSAPYIQSIQSLTTKHKLGLVSYFKVYFYDPDGDTVTLRITTDKALPTGYHETGLTNDDSPFFFNFLWVNKPGRRTITATVTDEHGLSSSKSITIAVRK